MTAPHFYLVIIGTEILNGRRNDAHFDFVKKLLLENNSSLFATFILEDDPLLIHNIFSLIKKDERSVLFSFGGIGSTPDDLTRQIAAEVFSDGIVVKHQQFEKDIIEKFGEGAYPYRINMAMLPKKSRLLYNPVNNMSGFQLEDRFFFVPGFPQMSHPMIQDAVETLFTHLPQKHRLTLTAQCSEEKLIFLMTRLPATIELSSLPQLVNNKPSVVLSLSSYEAEALQQHFDSFIRFLNDEKILFMIGDSLN